MSDDEVWQDEDPGRSGREAPHTPGRYERAMDEFDDEEFGGPLFAETSEHPVSSLGGSDEASADAGEPAADGPDARSDAPSDAAGSAESPGAGGEDERLSFGADDTGPLPHWTEPPTGEIPKIEASRAADDPDADVDVWSSFTTESPVWKEGDHVDDPSGTVGSPPADPTSELTWEDDPGAPVDPGVSGVSGVSGVVPTTDVAPPSEQQEAVTDVGRASERIMIGTDPSGMPRRPDPKSRGSRPQRPPGSGRPSGPPDRRNLPIAVASGVVLAAVFVALTMWRPAASLAFVTVLLGLGSIEYFSRVTEKGYRPAVAAGVLACISAPLGAYWVGEQVFPILIAFAFFAGAIGFIGADSIEAGPMPNMAITMLGVVWIGVLGGFAGLILRYSTLAGGTNWGTDTLVLLAIGVVANDVGAYFVGTAFGRTPLRAWISPHKSIEGFLGGAVLTLVVMLVIGLQDLSDTWSNTTHLLLLAVVISVMAPLGDLTESMFKRNLDVKDFGSIVQGHGGVLDRFDGFLFCVPAVYYLFLVIEPWTEFAG